MGTRERIEEVIATVLTPLLAVDGGGVELVDAHGDEVTLRLLGVLRGDPSTPIIKTKVIEPAIHAALRRKVRVVYDPSLPS